ncbi:hypothetical protein [Actinomyces minihominis]|uniref:hypothetical protein n=1 Tax=Actinomyces minihominis TaxID=2002838 RepID=UPI000C07C408|nr:hypothetical protein [Actinomyces minihominis]
MKDPAITSNEGECAPNDPQSVKEMTLEELQEAIEDKTHPRHKEAVKQSKDLADKMVPALQSLQRQVMSQVDMNKTLKSISESVVPSAVLDGLQESITKMANASVPAIRIPELKGGPKCTAVDLETPALALNHSYQQEIEEINASVAEANREREERAERQVEVSTAQLETLETMAANLQQLNQQMASVDSRLTENNESATKWSRWTIAIASLTLLATVAGIIVTALLGQS